MSNEIQKAQDNSTGVGRAPAELQSMKLLTPTQVAEQLSISRSLVYQIVKSGDLPCHRIGKGRGSIRVSEADLREYIRNTRIAHGERSRKSTARPRLKHLRI